MTDKLRQERKHENYMHEISVFRYALYEIWSIQQVMIVARLSIFTDG